MLICQECESTDVVKNGIKHGVQTYSCNDCNSYKQPIDTEVETKSAELAKRVQRFQDTNRIERKTFREQGRLSNALEEYEKELISLLKTHQFSTTKKQKPTKELSAAVLHISDWHLNELVDLPNNRYDFGVASKRVQKYVNIARKVFKTFNVTNVLVAMTGDMINSDRRLDELLNQATNRSQATFLAVDLIQSALLDLNKDFILKVACVSGNESRVNKDHAWSHNIMTDNYDFTIFNILKKLFEGTDITFLDGNPVEMVVRVGNKNVLLIHGEQKILGGTVERGVAQLCGKYVTQGIMIDFVLFGHLHCARIGDYFARASSLVGANSYSDSGLQLISKASQNIHIMTQSSDIHSIKIDLQNTDGYEGYEFNKELEAYNAKSASKLHANKTIFEVII